VSSGPKHKACEKRKGLKTHLSRHRQESFGGYFSRSGDRAVGFSRSRRPHPSSFKETVNLAMTDQELVLSALRQIG
jgi:hypothetical protein